MALLITERCTNCDMCEPECPNSAIVFAAVIYEIDPARCTECKGHYDEPTCQAVCPISRCIVPDPQHIETDDELLDKFVALQGLI
ncbi:YfhL family 4Fe-4S dicluster ferredoxin [Saccharospirillum mangrovi]|uniref:YfhL family 4Fe-4S dicluster ferredoxin n=1 Tax=Saccharospirillum mangrovi TaxID=2161747 RepID=UPI000D3B97DB|nr:YfhL family 4Fe-4S dicluster ferredoxin [Saccharospirillum mangrovi]